MGCGSSKELARGKDLAESRHKAAIESRIECIEESRSCVVGGAQVRYAYLSQRGYYPDDQNKPNQDALSITHEFGGVETDAFMAVYDGHGRHGDKCAQFAKHRLPDFVAKHLRQEKLREAKVSRLSRLGISKRKMESGRNLSKRSLGAKSPSASSVGSSAKNLQDSMTGRSVRGSIAGHDLTKEQLHTACLKAHVQCNLSMHRNSSLDDSLSGTTSISAYFHGPRNKITVCNVGDSRAVLGQRRRKAEPDPDTDDPLSPSPLRALPLSRDHTPYRKDERARVKKAGARILSLDQIEGLEPENEDWGEDMVLGEEIDEWGDPPRVWSPHGEYPGTAFTRSFGDNIAEELGVFAEPEMITRELSDDDKIIVLASDGVFEFLTNQSVIDMCVKFQDPLEACRAVVAEAYELWLQYELRTDDITIICIFIDGRAELPDMEEASKRVSDAAEFKDAINGELIGLEDNDNDYVPSEGMRPVRQCSSRNACMAIEAKSTRKIMLDKDDIDISTLITEKTEQEKRSIAEAIKAMVMFQNISDEQREMIFGVMESVEVKKGDRVIKQGSVGDKFYIVDEGRFEVRIVPDGEEPENHQDGGPIVHVYDGSRKTHAHPSFGELALMHSAPRAASVIAQTEGHVWALHRSAFREVLKKQSDRRGLLRVLLRVLRKNEEIKVLTAEEVETLSKCAKEVTFNKDDVIVKEGELGDTFYYIIHGLCISTTKSDEEKRKTLVQNHFFGEKMLFGKTPCETTVTATATTKCFKLSLDVVEETVGNLKKRREEIEKLKGAEQQTS